MADGDREGIGCVVGARRLGQRQERRHHPRHLLLAGAAGAAHGALHLLWIGYQDGQSHLLWSKLRGSQWSKPVDLSGGSAWMPGAASDSKGNLYVAAKGLQVYSHEGKLLHSFDLAETPSNCAFGDDGSTLYIAANHDICRIKTTTKGKGF